MVKNPQVVESTFGFKPEEYAQAIADVALAALDEHAIVIVGHNGPIGLGMESVHSCHSYYSLRKSKI